LLHCPAAEIGGVEALRLLRLGVRRRKLHREDRGGSSAVVQKRHRNLDDLEIAVVVRGAVLNDGRHEDLEIGRLQRAVPQTVAGEDERERRNRSSEISARVVRDRLDRGFGRLLARLPALKPRHAPPPPLAPSRFPPAAARAQSLQKYDGMKTRRREW